MGIASAQAVGPMSDRGRRHRGASTGSTSSSPPSGPGARGRRSRASPRSSGCSRRARAALEDAAGALLHAAYTFISLDGPLPGLFAEQAGALLAVAARFEEAADLTRTRQSD